MIIERIPAYLADAIVPIAKIVLIQAASSSITDLFKALQVAVAQPNVVAVSMSWGATEFSGSDDACKRPCVICSASSAYDDVAGLGVPNVGNLLGYF
jgi:hypothetical protein